MRIYISSIPVDDVAKAHAFYTEKLGFVVKDDVTHGDFRWLTITNADQDGHTSPPMELLLEPKAHPAAQPWTKALKADGVPITQFASDDVEAEYQALKEKGVDFTMPPTDVGPAIIAVFDDTVGNLVQIVELKEHV